MFEFLNLKASKLRMYFTASFSPEEIEEMIKSEPHELSCLIYICTCENKALKESQKTGRKTPSNSAI